LGPIGDTGNGVGVTVLSGRKMVLKPLPVNVPLKLVRGPSAGVAGWTLACLASTASNSKLLGSSSARVSGAGSSLGSAAGRTSGGASVTSSACPLTAAPFALAGVAVAVAAASFCSSAMVPTLPLSI
jgi:hypothetical protein